MPPWQSVSPPRVIPTKAQPRGGIFALSTLRTSVDIGQRNLATYTYTNDGNNYLSALDYGNGDGVQYEYDGLGRVTKETYEDNDTVTYRYDNSGALATVTDSETGRTTTYYYDFTDRLMKYVETGENYYHSVGYEYDTDNNLTSLVESINGTDYITSYTYDDDNRVSSMLSGSNRVDYTYDEYGRLSTKITRQGTESTDPAFLTETYTYVGNTTDATTSTQIATYEVETASYSVTYTYTYDDNGNILSIHDGTYTTDYVYDSANQLIQENNARKNQTDTWTYDNAGNIQSHKTYAYTTDLITGTDVPTAADTYAYNDDKGWGDLLTAYNGASIEYDEIGNPTSDGTWTYTWEHGRQLASMFDGTGTWNYTYNSDGMRTLRAYGMLTYEYVYNGSQLTQMVMANRATRVLKTLSFAYDANGFPMTVTYDGTVYYYATNVQGDVVAILNSSGTAVVTYTYDAWGNILSTGGTMDDTLGATNPLRYRGYVYDQETELYYLQSRYYDPEIGRFINADNQLNEKDGLLGYNQFAYCHNNPIMYSDATGHSFTLACIIVGAVIGAIAGACIGASVSKKKTGEVNGWAVAGGAVGGAVVGGLAGWGVGAAITAVGATATTAASGTIAQVGQTIYKNWQSAEAALRKTINSVADYGSRVLSTPMGNRVVDAYNTSTKVIAEAKYGYQAYSQFIQTEVARDAYLLQSGMVNEVQWHFYYSEASGTIGGSYNLIRALLDAGIQVFYH